ncbi:relaxase/mobilization nuclease domain-containing protein [Flavobacterium sp. Sd200]|uniref:relaxase/mobilization nuclease domain-containing protein n=1 Tax=Flavobacterium sp. Sd200 TaxID=2692211 RepID=UPI0013701833|nr:relaxase/mobilization nuclease domain-containing protein [Flavobacterium sp. Sd200]MXN91135.1 relaxase/mobilization nuclease domain-containing protein [Flavobacterium sp. Sd200]
MVAVIKAGRSIHRIFNYNENKVKEGKAEIIGAGNYPFDPEKTSLNIRLNRLVKQLQLREDVKVNSVHISLNFDPSEGDLPNEKMMQVAETYMEKIGFGDQPFLVYRHNDAGHPHLHLVTTNITAEAKRISLHHLGINKSEPARKEIEKVFGLVPAQGQKNNIKNTQEPARLAKVNYGRTASKKAIQVVLDNVLNHYKYASLAELNAVLRQYNMLADQGKEGSRIFRSGGLLYHILNDEGRPIGIPIKSSSFYNKPTLKFLESQYAANKVKRTPYRSRVTNAVDMVFLGEKISLPDFMAALNRQGIHIVLRQSDSGAVYGITYVDHTTKCIFNGSELGKSYSAKAILERCKPALVQGQHLPGHASPLKGRLQPPREASAAETERMEQQSEKASILEVLTQAEQLPDYVPYPLKGNSGKKRKGKRPNK